MQKATFCEPIRRRRCLVPINSSFEWQVVNPNTKKKQPWEIALKSKGPFALADIWYRWEDNQRNIVLETYAIITCVPNELLRPLHDRMPVLVQPDDYGRWLNPGDPKNPPMDSLKPFPDELMTAWRVNRMWETSKTIVLI